VIGNEEKKADLGARDHSWIERVGQSKRVKDTKGWVRGFHADALWQAREFLNLLESEPSGRGRFCLSKKFYSTLLRLLAESRDEALLGAFAARLQVRSQTAGPSHLADLCKALQELQVGTPVGQGDTGKNAARELARRLLDSVDTA
jgi:hypothetical protein